MADGVKRVAPRLPTPLPRGDTARTTTRLPDELVADQVRRLTYFCVVAASLWTFALVMDAVIVPLSGAPAAPNNAFGFAVEAAQIVMAWLMLAYLRWSNHAPATKTDVGLVYMLANAAGIAAFNNLMDEPFLTRAMQASWIAVLILAFSISASSTPRKMLIGSLLAAAMDPLAVGVGHLLGRGGPSAVVTLILYAPNFAVAAVAMLPSHVFQRLGKRLREAQELGSYELKELLGKGGMGEVWRAHHRLLARSAAVKLVRPELLGAAGDVDARLMLRRFEREARATAALNSPHTIQLFDFGSTDEGTFYYVMELLVGRDLESLIKEFGPVPSDRAVFLLRQVCHSLADAHARGFVHRDIKPANIYVCRMGLDYDFVKVLDFGLVKVSRSRGRADTLTTLEHTTGTPAYMAPEIILGDADVDRRADVYALGCVAYYLLTGQLVFEADTPMKMLLQHVNARPVPPSQRTELAVPPDLEHLVMSCLEKDPANRPQDAEQLFHLACGCTSCETWNQSRARRWWQVHLPDLSGPLPLEDVAGEGVSSQFLQHQGDAR